MGAPGRVYLGVNKTGLVMGVRPNDRVEDAIYDCVQQAIEAGWTPTQFKRTLYSAWEYELKEKHERELRELDSEV